MDSIKHALKLSGKSLQEGGVDAYLVFMDKEAVPYRTAIRNRYDPVTDGSFGLRSINHYCARGYTLLRVTVRPARFVLGTTFLVQTQVHAAEPLVGLSPGAL